MIALVHITPTDDGNRVSVTLEPPETSLSTTGEFRPTLLMERVSKYLEEEPGATSRRVREAVSGKGAFIDQALRVLVAEGFVRAQVDGQARRHYIVTEYREEPSR